MTPLVPPPPPGPPGPKRQLLFRLFGMNPTPQGFIQVSVITSECLLLKLMNYWEMETLVPIQNCNVSRYRFWVFLSRRERSVHVSPWWRPWLAMRWLRQPGLRMICHGKYAIYGKFCIMMGGRDVHCGRQGWNNSNEMVRTTSFCDFCCGFHAVVCWWWGDYQ